MNILDDIFHNSVHNIVTLHSVTEHQKLSLSVRTTLSSPKRLCQPCFNYVLVCTSVSGTEVTPAIHILWLNRQHTSHLGLDIQIRQTEVNFLWNVHAILDTLNTKIKYLELAFKMWSNEVSYLKYWQHSSLCILRIFWCVRRPNLILCPSSRLNPSLFTNRQSTALKYDMNVLLYCQINLP